MMNKWSKNYDKCRNCGTVRLKQVARGYCIRCYTLIRKLEQIGSWNLSDPQTLKGYPSGAIFHTPEMFKKIKAGFTKQIKERLVFLETSEETLAGPICGIHIEMQLRRIAHKCRVRDKRLFVGVAGYIDQTFDAKRKRILYELLNKIEEASPWRGIDWYRILHN